MPRVFALTGGQGNGIRLVAKTFAAQGVPCVHADEVFHEVLREATFDLLKGKKDATIEETAALLWTDPKTGQETFERLREATYLRLGDRLREKLAEAPLTCLYAPSLIEMGQHERFRPLVVVVTPYERQIREEMVRGGLSEAEAKARLSWEVPQSQKVLLADFLLDNKGTEEELVKEATWTLEAIRKLYSEDLKAKGPR